MATGPVITKQLTDGRTATVIVVEHLKGIFRARVDVGGRHFTTGRVGPLTPPRGPATHQILGGGKALGLTATEADRVTTAIEQAEAAWSQSPEGRHATLRDQRGELARELRDREAADADDKARAHDRGELDRYFRDVQPANERRIAEAERALATFDREHPEVLAAIKQAAAERTARHMWD